MAVALLIPAAPARAGLETVLQDDAQLLHRPEDQLRRSLEEMRILGVDRIRVTAGWSVLTRNADSTTRPNFDAADPRAYEQERWRNLDRLLILAQEYGFRTMVDIAFWAPHWASTDPAGERGRTNIDIDEFQKFAVAVARRYSGTFIIPRVVAAEARGPIQESEDEKFLKAGYGSTNPEGGTTLHDVLGIPLLGQRSSTAVEAALGEDPTAPLPKVELFTIWNEPNHSSFMRPQWSKWGKRWVPHSPHVYRTMVQKAYPAIKAVRPDSTILIGGTSFSGSYSGRGTGNVPPLRFLREMACVGPRLKPLKRSGCKTFTSVPGDGWAHHPYTMNTEPDVRSKVNRPDDVPVADLPKLAKTLDGLVRRGRMSPAARNIWITEYGYETNPPVKGWIWTPGDQARFLPWAEYLAARVPTVRSFAQFLLRDLPPGAFRVGNSKKRALGQWQSGLLFENGTPKLGVHSFRTGLFVQELAGHRLRIFGRLRLGPGVRAVAIDRRPPGSNAWRTIATSAPGAKAPVDVFNADGGDSFLRFGFGTKSRGWRYRVRYLEGSTWRADAPSVTPVVR